jgi:nickel-dependent lactate racemase
MPLADVASSLRTLLSRPTAGAPLADLARGARRVGVVVPDRTRSAGLDELLPTVVAAVGEASPGAGVTVIVGGGTHAGDDPGAWTRRLPDGVSLVVHDARDDASLRSLGTTGRGTPVALAAAAVDADLLVVLGGIGFHYFAGYSGGRKGIFPGLGGYEAIRRNHALVLVGDPGRGLHPACRPGNLLGNPVHLDALEAARLVGPEVFLINVALDARGRVEDLVTGDLAVAHAAGAARYGARHTATLDAPVDLVLADGGGHPGDLDLVQTHKSLRHAAPAVRDGGALVLLARCEEGVGSATMARWFDHPTADEIEDALRADYTLNSHTALSVRRITERVRLHLVSELDPALVRRMGAVPHADPETAVRAARDEVGASASGLVLRSPATVRIESPSSPA